MTTGARRAANGYEMRANRHLFMVRPNLDALPPVCLPKDFALRTYRPGDEAAWLEIIRMSFEEDQPADAFQRRIASDEAFRPERVLFSTFVEQPVGTVTAFQKLAHGDRTGYVHMLGVRPDFQKRGLGSALLRACLHYFRDQGWRDAVLDTEARRVPALRLYLAHGFLPFPENAEELTHWRTILSCEGRRDLAARLRQGACPEP